MTDEQVDAIDGFRTGAILKVTAGAGAGKTSTLKAMTETMAPGKTARYLAFNNSVAAEARRKMPDHVTASTVHSLAINALPQHLRDRVSGDRIASFELARRFRVQPMRFDVDGVVHEVTRNQVASLAYRGVTKFCESAEAVPTEDHAPVVRALNWRDPKGYWHKENNELLARTLVPLMRRIWSAVQDPTGDFPISHDHYVKLYERSDLDMGCDVLLMDEAQDVNAVFASLCFKQMARGTQLVAVGDPNQAIYGWRGAIDAFALLPAATRAATLSMSFRFGQAIADVANIALDELCADIRLRGNPAKDSVVDRARVPDAFLCRTNAAAVGKYLDATGRGHAAFLMGGGTEMLSFARAAEKLQAGKQVEHPDLGCFQTWEEVGDYVQSDPSGSDLATSYDLVETFGAGRLVTALSKLPKSPRAGQTIVSTTHKAKGLEWPSVRLADDFAFSPEGSPLPAEEIRLLYVAATRAQDVLDISACPYFSTAARWPTALAS
jgi:hypothetical protein